MIRFSFLVAVIFLLVPLPVCGEVIQLSPTPTVNGKGRTGRIVAPRVKARRAAAHRKARRQRAPSNVETTPASPREKKVATMSKQMHRDMMRKALHRFFKARAARARATPQPEPQPRPAPANNLLPALIMTLPRLAMLAM